FDVKYVKNSGEIINEIINTPRSFGYVDIANFLDAIDQNISLKRQFFYPVKLEGLSFIYPKQTDWYEPINDYFNSQQYNLDKFKIITKYLGSDATEIINRISKSAEIGPLEEIVISNREKEAQYERLLEAFQKDKENERTNTILTAIIITGLALFILLYLLYRLKAKNNEQLLEQQRVIEERNKQLKNLNEEKNNLIQVLAHDLRSPLGNIQNGSQIISERERLSEDGKKLLGFIIQSSKNMTALIAKILDVNAIESGKHNLKYEAFEIGKVIKEVVDENESKASNKSIRLMIDEIGNQEVNADKIYTSQIIDNLISNAIKYSNEGSEVSISTTFEKDKVKISVADEGPGLTKEDELKIFKKYEQLSAKPTKGEDSTGLGLSIVKTFAERMGGSVSFDSKLGEGTTFHVYLQRA
ncbi:MAG: HAMP domain-containing sensor histidine kinase, partial [Bacteroidota bacterium]